MDKDRIIILFQLFSATLCDSNSILNVKIEQVEQKLATNTIYDFTEASLKMSTLINSDNADFHYNFLVVFC